MYSSEYFDCLLESPIMQIDIEHLYGTANDGNEDGTFYGHMVVVNDDDEDKQLNNNKVENSSDENDYKNLYEMRIVGDDCFHDLVVDQYDGNDDECPLQQSLQYHHRMSSLSSPHHHLHVGLHENDKNEKETDDHDVTEADADHDMEVIPGCLPEMFSSSFSCLAAAPVPTIFDQQQLPTFPECVSPSQQQQQDEAVEEFFCAAQEDEMDDLLTDIFLRDDISVEMSYDGDIICDQLPSSTAVAKATTMTTAKEVFCRQVSSSSSSSASSSSSTSTSSLKKQNVGIVVVVGVSASTARGKSIEKLAEQSPVKTKIPPEIHVPKKTSAETTASSSSSSLPPTCVAQAAAAAVTTSKNKRALVSQAKKSKTAAVASTTSSGCPKKAVVKANCSSPVKKTNKKNNAKKVMVVTKSSSSASTVSLEEENSVSESGGVDDNDHRSSSCSSTDGNGDEPTDRDVLCGKGGKTLLHNRHFTRLCNEYAVEYSTTKKRGLSGKKGIALKIVQEVKAAKGRFLKPQQQQESTSSSSSSTGKSKKNKNSSNEAWEEISDEHASTKVAHCMRDIVRRLNLSNNNNNDDNNIGSKPTTTTN